MSSAMSTLGKRPRSPISTKRIPPSDLPPQKKPRVILRPKQSRPSQPQPSPSPFTLPLLDPSVPLEHFLKRGIVPLLPSSREEPFDWHAPMNLATFVRHLTTSTYKASLRTLIRTGRKFPGSTPSITMETPADYIVVRYEYWPVFDEYPDEDEWKPSWPKQQTPLGKPLTEEQAEELREYFYRPSHIPETVDF